MNKQRNSITDGRPFPTKAKLWISLVLLIFMGIGGVPLWFGILGVREAHESVMWPTVPGTIKKSLLDKTTQQEREQNESGRIRTTTTYSAEIEYEFVVDGFTHHGTRISVVSDQFGSKDYAEALLEKYPNGREVEVSYKPGQPDECVLEPGRWGGAGFQFLFGGLFIVVPLLILRAVWSPADASADPHHSTKEERQRFGLVFRERFLEWEPGRRIHLHRDHLGIFSVLAGALIAGLIGGTVFGLPVAFWLFSGKGPFFIAQVYAAVSLVLAICGSIWLGLDSRRRDTVIDWDGMTVHAQVGWFSRQFTFDDVQELVLQISRPSKSDTSSDPTQTYPARVLLHVGGKRYILLEVECHRSDIGETQQRLQKIAEELAVQLKVSVA